MSAWRGIRWGSLVRTLLSAVVLAVVSAPVVSAAAAPAAKAQRIAVVNLERVFREFYKSAIAEDAIKRQAEAYRSYLMELNTQQQALSRAAQLANVNARNLALSEEERGKYAAEAETKTREAKEKAAEIELYATERSQAMRELEERKRTEIMDEILREINSRAMAEGYDFVLDCSGRTLNDQPLVLRFPAEDDLTEAVIRKLNSTRTTPAEAKEKTADQSAAPAAAPESANPQP